MKKVNILLNIYTSLKQSSAKILPNNNKPQTLEFTFHYISTTTFAHLMDYITSITQLKICPCYIFYLDKFQIQTMGKINIREKYGLINNKKISLSLILTNCNCPSIFKYFSLSKIEILKSYYESIELYKAKIKSFMVQLDKLKNNNKELEKDNKILKNPVKGDFSTLNKLKEEGLANDLRPKNVLKVDPTTKIIKGNINDYQNNKNENNEVIFEDFYEAIIDIKSVSYKNSKKGWKIKMNDRGKKNYEECKNKRVLKIGVIGNANKGKSYILSRISKIDLPSDNSIRTEGLSIKYPELTKFKNSRITLLDSAGLDCPVLTENEINSEILKNYLKKNQNNYRIIFIQLYY